MSILILIFVLDHQCPIAHHSESLRYPVKRDSFWQDIWRLTIKFQTTVWIVNQDLQFHVVNTAVSWSNLILKFVKFQGTNGIFTIIIFIIVAWTWRNPSLPHFTCKDINICINTIMSTFKILLNESRVGAVSFLYYSLSIGRAISVVSDVNSIYWASAWSD